MRKRTNNIDNINLSPIIYIKLFIGDIFMSDQQAAQKLQSIQNRQTNANNKIIRYKTELQSVTEQLNAAWKEVQEKYGVSTLDELRTLYKSKSDEREQKIANAEKELQEIEAILSMVDEEIAKIKA